MGKYSQTARKQTGKRGLMISLAVIAAVLTGIVAAAVWVTVNYHIVAGKFYPRDMAVLDLREEDMKPEHVDKLRKKMPDCEIRWNIPFQGGALADDVTEITITSLTEQDVRMLGYARDLESVQAEGCTDYDALELLRRQRPELTVSYGVTLSSGSYSWDMETLVLNSVTEEDISLLKYLPNLERVVLSGGSYDDKTVEMLRDSVHTAGLEFGVILGGNILPDTEQILEISEITDEELNLLPYLKGLQELLLINPKADPEKVFALEKQLDGVKVSCQVTLGDRTYDDRTTEVDFSDMEVKDLAEVEQKLAYLPNLETVTFGLCGVDNPEWGNSRSKLTSSAIENEDLAAYRNRVRDRYKVVWTVRLGPSIALRTDADNFMPNHFGVGVLPDDYAYNLRYCEEMVCLDVGHMTLTDISFVEYMPNLKYLILAWTQVQYIEPIRSCKNLVFLELDWSLIKDISPLVDCTALEDLNLGRTYCDIEPLLQMPWLKNVYMILRSKAGVVGQALPDTRVITSADPDAATVGYGWRRLPNYYAMRDCLHAPYMN